MRVVLSSSVSLALCLGLTALAVDPPPTIPPPTPVNPTTEVRWEDRAIGAHYILLDKPYTYDQAKARCRARGFELIDPDLLKPADRARFLASPIMQAIPEDVQFPGEPSEIRSKTFWTFTSRVEVPHLGTNVEINQRAVIAAIDKRDEAGPVPVKYSWTFSQEGRPPTELPKDRENVSGTRHYGICEFRKAPLLECTALRTCRFYEPADAYPHYLVPLWSRLERWWMLAPGNERAAKARMEAAMKQHGPTDRGRFSCDMNLEGFMCTSIR